MTAKPGIQHLCGYRLRDYDDLIAMLVRSREIQDVSQRALAARLGVSQAAVSRWLGGMRTGNADVPFDLADALGYDLALIPREDS